MNKRTMKPSKNIAFVVNDSKKSELIEWSYFNKELLLPHEIIATGAAGNILEGTLNKKINKLLNGPLGGYGQLAEMVTDGKIDAVIFFGTSGEAQARTNELDNLIETALLNNIIVAGNRTTADFVLTSFLMNKNYAVETVEPTDQPKTELTATKKFAAVTIE